MATRNRRTIGVVVLVLGLGACGGSAHQATSSTAAPSATTTVAATTTAAATTTVAATTTLATTTTIYGQQYLRIMGPANAAGDTFAAQARSLPASAGVMDLARIARPLATALDTAAQKLARATWPTSAQQDVKALIVATSVAVADLTSVSSQDVGSITAWASQFSGDMGKRTGEITLVRADLGLPPVALWTAPGHAPGGTVSPTRSHAARGTSLVNTCCA